MPLTPPPSAPPAAPSAPGDAPSRANPTTFRALADAFVVWLVSFRASLADLRDWIAGYLTWAGTHITELEALQADVTSQAGTATTQAGLATTKAGEASTSAAAAAVSEANSLSYLQAYRATSYGALADDPAEDPNGNAPTAGDEYFNTTANLIKRFNGATWQASDINTADLAAPTGSGLVGFINSISGSVARTWEGKGRETISVQDVGILPGAAYAVTNCDRMAVLAAAVTALGGNVSIVWPAATEAYQFSPRTNSNFNASTSAAWRAAIEMVDVVNVYHLAAGARIHLDADPTWTRGNPLPAGSGLDEGVIQFRATTFGACDRVGIIGPVVLSTDDTVDASSAASDGAAFGVAYRGCTNTLTAHVKAEYWGTDGIYYGTAYADAFGGQGHVLVEPETNRCHRQGISVVNNSHGLIVGGYLHDTYGGSFGHGIDFEPNGSNTQEGWTLIGTATKDNQRGACNFINTSDVTWINPSIDEQHAAANAAIYIDGSNVVGHDTSDIRFLGGSVKALHPLVYSDGSAVAGGGIDNILFGGGIKLSCVGAAPASSAWLRINPNGRTGRKIGRFIFDNCHIDGNGGFVFKSDGTNAARLTLRNCRWHLKNHAGTALAFAVSTASALDVVDLDGVEMSIEAGATLATNAPYIVKGSLKNCKLSGQAGAIITWLDYGAGRTDFIIGYNEFSAYNYYKGVVTALNMQLPGTVQAPLSGDMGLPGRVMHGGRQRLISYLATPAVFINQQAPADGDVCHNVGNSAAGTAETEFIYDNNAARWRLNKWVTKKGTTPNRPSPTTLAAVMEGLTYLDTTLAANGKPIFWNGAAWVDATGAVV